MSSVLFDNRFKIYLTSQLAVLFGSLLIPTPWFESIFYPIILQLNLFAGLLLVSKNKKVMYFVASLLILSSLTYVLELVNAQDFRAIGFIQLAVYFVFHLIVSWHLVKQVWKAKHVDEKVIFGLISGYISLGLIGFFICLTIEVAVPGSFQGLYPDGNASNILSERMLYFSYITLLTVGYGDILPVTNFSQKATVLIGLIGQLYLVIFTAVIVSKYIAHSDSKKGDNKNYD